MLASPTDRRSSKPISWTIWTVGGHTLGVEEEALEEAPTEAERAMLRVCRADPAMLDVFFRQFYPREGVVAGDG